VTPSQREDAALYVAWLRSDRDLSPGVPIRADMATFIEQLIRPEQRGRTPTETVLQRYRRHHERMPWIRRVEQEQLKLKAQRIRRHFEQALQIVSGEPGAPAAETLRKWLRSPRFRGNSRFLPLLDDGVPNVDPDPI
jgi:hypothetical protein